MFKIGDRVRYKRGHPSLGDSRHDGKLGTVLAEPCTGHVRIQWDPGQSYVPSNPFIENLELFDMKTIDTTKLLAVRNEYGVYDVTFVTETSDGNIMVDMIDGNGLIPGWMIFDHQGKFVRSKSGNGTACTLEEKVERFVLYQAIGQVAKGYVMSAAYDSPEPIRRLGKQMVRVISENGRVVSVTLVD